MATASFMHPLANNGTSCISLSPLTVEACEVAWKRSILPFLFIIAYCIFSYGQGLNMFSVNNLENNPHKTSTTFDQTRMHLCKNRSLLKTLLTQKALNWANLFHVGMLITALVISTALGGQYSAIQTLILFLRLSTNPFKVTFGTVDRWRPRNKKMKTESLRT